MRRQSAARLSWSTAEKKTAIVLGLAIVLWATDFAHHIDPAVIALGAGLAVALPGIGVLTTKDIRGVNFLLTVFLGAALSMGTVLIQTKALNVLTGADGVVDDAHGSAARCLGRACSTGQGSCTTSCWAANCRCSARRCR